MFSYLLLFVFLTVYSIRISPVTLYERCLKAKKTNNKKTQKTSPTAIFQMGPNLYRTFFFVSDKRLKNEQALFFISVDNLGKQTTLSCQTEADW